jgi:hypothetical protein
MNMGRSMEAEMEGIKGFLESKAVWGGIVALAGSALGIGHYTLSTADAAQAVELVVSITTAVGSLVAIYGRVVASKKIG